MSIAFERSSGDSIHSSAFMPRFLGGVFSGDRRFPRRTTEVEEEEDDSSSTTSSIGRNSDVEDDSNEESEVQSSINKGPLDTLDALEEVLPIKKGISKFYNGKSKSFTSLEDVSSASSIKDFVKPEDPYTRKRKILLARNTFWDDKNRNLPPKDCKSCIPKKPTTSNRSTSELASSMNCPKSKNRREEVQSVSSSPNCCLPPLHPHAKTSPSNRSGSPPLQRNSNWRSFSLSDLQCAASAATSNT